MPRNLPSLLRQLAILAGVVILSIAAGFGVGIAVSKVRGTPSVTPPPFAVVDGALDPSGATGATGSTAAPAATTEADPAEVDVTSSVLEPATTDAGRARRRARVTVRVAVSAGEDPLKLSTAFLVSGEDEIGFDPNARDAAGALLQPIDLGETARGELRFETSGDVTDRLTSTKRASLRIAGQTVRLRLTNP